MDVEKIAQQKSLIGARLRVRPVVIATVLAIAFFALLASGAKQYRATVSILVIAKSQAAAQEQGMIVANIASLPQTLSFFDRLTQDNPSIKDPAAGKAPDERKNIWSAFITVEQPQKNTGSLIDLSVRGKSPGDAEALSLKAAHTLFSMASRYYNIKDDVDLRIVDGPVTSAEIPEWQWLALWSILFGAAVAFLMEKMSPLGKRSASGGRESFGNVHGALRDLGKAFVVPNTIKPISTLEDIYLSEDQPGALDIPDTMDYGQPESAEQVPLETQIIPPKWEYPNFPEMPARNGSQSSAPANLPIADEGIFPDDSPVIIEAYAPAEQIGPHAIKQTEPTQEEIKNRLNQLLKGKA